MEFAHSAVLGPLSAFASAAAWSVGSVGYSQLSTKYSGYSINFARAMIALPLFGLSAVLLAGPISGGLLGSWHVKWDQLSWLSISIFTSYGLGDVLFLKSTNFLGVPGAMAIGSIYPVWAVLAGYLFLKESLSFYQLLGILITILGLAAVILSAPERERGALKNRLDVDAGLEGGAVGHRKRLWVGVPLALATSLAWAMNGYAIARTGSSIFIPLANAIRMVVALILCSVLGRVFTPQVSIFLPRKEIRRYFWVFVLEAFGGSSLSLYGLTHSSLALGITLASLSPVISVPIALLSGRERFSLFGFLGILCTVGGISILLSC